MSNTGLGKNLSKLYDLFFDYGRRVITDSRLVKQQPGCIFFALRGERFDGNLYARQAVADGAAAAVVSALPEGIGPEEEEKYFVVKDTLEALQEFARLHRETLGLPILALTGSNGKTTTKELVTKVLATKYQVRATQGNLNNHIGVPLTLLSFTEDDDIGIVEMGANHRGEIASLCEIARPDIGLITNVGHAHLEGFGGFEGVKEAKGELYEYLARHNGTVIYSAEDPVLTEMAEIHFGRNSDWEGIEQIYSSVELGVSADNDSPEKLTVKTRSGKRYPTRMTGSYNLANIMAALAVGRYFGIETEDALEAITTYEPDNNRSQVVVSKATGNTLYMDAYNANPSSMKAALDNFLGIPIPEKEKRVLILGDMRELGDYAKEEHRKIWERLAPEVEQKRIELFLVGDLFRTVANPAGIGNAFSHVEELKDYLTRNPLPKSHILIKGSRGIALEKVYDLL